MNALLFCWMSTKRFMAHILLNGLYRIFYFKDTMFYKKLEFFTDLFCTGPNFALFVNNRSPKSSHCWTKCSQSVRKATGRHSFSKPFASWKHYCSFAVCFWPLPRVILPALPEKKGSQEESLIHSRQKQSGLTYLNGVWARADDIFQDIFGSTHTVLSSSKTERVAPSAAGQLAAVSILAQHHWT